MAYVYALIDPRDDSWFYLGKGTGRRMRDHFALSELGKQTHKAAKIRKLKREEYKPYPKKLLEGVSEELACFVEGELIDKHYDDLTNYCRAGEPRWSEGMPDEIRQKIKRNTPSPKGRTMSEEAKRRMSQAQRGGNGGNNKLNADEVAEIKWYLECADFRFKKAALAGLYGIAPTTLSAIQSGAAWEYVEHQEPEQVSEIVRGSQGQLREHEASEIKWLAQQSYRQRDIAEAYGVGVGAIGPIKHGENFSDVEPQKPKRIPDGLEKGWTHLSKREAAEAKWLLQNKYRRTGIAEIYGVSPNQVYRIKTGECRPGLNPQRPDNIPDWLGKTGLTEQEAGEIKYLAKSGDLTHYEIADRYNIDQSNVSKIKTGKRWSNVTENKPA